MVIRDEPQSSSFSKNKAIRLTLGCTFFGLVMALPSGVPAWFDGLPWTNGLETLTVMVIIPFFLFLGYRFISLPMSVIFLTGLLFFKLVMYIGAPAGGLLVKVYPNLDDELLNFYTNYRTSVMTPTADQANIHINRKNYFTEGWIETFATFWNKEASAILKKPWLEKLAFPMSWAVPICEFPICDPGNELNFNPVIEIEGSILLPEGKKFALIAEGIEEGSLRAKNEDGTNFILIPAKNREEAGQPQYQIPKSGNWHISGKLKYSGVIWSLIPILIEADGSSGLDLGRDVLWQKESVISISSGTIQFYKLLSFVIDSAICLFFMAWGIWTTRQLIQEQVLTLQLFLFSTLAVLSPLILEPLITYSLGIANITDPLGYSTLGIILGLVVASFVLWSHLKADDWNIQPHIMVRSLFLLFGPAMFLFFSNTWWSELGLWRVWNQMDDWSAYQYFGRNIIVFGEWLTGGESALMGRELYPYLTGISHMLFGQSSFSLQMFDVWCVFGASLILAGFVVNFHFSYLTAIITSTCYLMICLVGAFRYHIGRSLTENTAMFFMMLAAWYIYRGREGGWTRVILATIFGILGYWARQDHIGAVFGLAFLALEPIKGSTGGWKGYWHRFQSRWPQISWYWAGGMIFGIGTLCLRNYVIGVGFVFADTSIRTIAGEERIISIFETYYMIITGDLWPVFPSIAGIVTILGVFGAFLALIWRPKVLLNFPMGLGITIVCLLIPYFFAINVSYAPRWSIHLLPLAVLSFMLISSSIINLYFKKGS